MELLKKTQSLCPVCLSRIDAEIIEKNGKVYINKNCTEHGNFAVLLEKDASFYKRVIHKTYQKRTHFNTLMIPVTHQCNLNCTFCYLPKRDSAELTSEEIKNIIKNFKGKKIRFGGGEPTLREDLPELIRFTTENKKIPVLVTNGLKLADMGYSKKLYDSGLRFLCLAFNGFKTETDTTFFGENVSNLKLQAFYNAKKLKIRTLISMLVHRGTNEKEMSDIFKLCWDNRGFVFEFRLRTSNLIGKHVETEPFTLSELFELLCKSVGIEKQLAMNSLLRERRTTSSCTCKMRLNLYEKDNKPVLRKPNSSSKPSFILSLRSWPNKYNIDLEEMNNCLSSHLTMEKEELPFCYAIIMNECKNNL